MKFYSKIIITLFFVISLLEFPNKIKGDLPVHCLTKEVQGMWKFHMTQTQTGQQACGHESPDENTDHVYQNYDGFKEHTSQTLNLVMPNVVTDSSGKNIGTWTMVYDEGFEIETNDLNFFAFSKYSIEDGRSPKNTDDEQTSGYTFDCDKTFTGWYHDKYNKWGCFYGEKTNSNDYKEKTNSQDVFTNGQGMKIVQRDDLVQEGKDKNNYEQDSQKLDEDENKILDQEKKLSLPSITDELSNGNNQYEYNHQNYNDDQQGGEFFNNIMAVSGSGDSQDFFAKQNNNIKSLEQQISDTLNGLNNEPQFKQTEQTKTQKQAEQALQKNEPNDFYERFKQQLPLYDLPHSDYLQFNTTIQDKLNEPEGFFELDYQFIELVNNVKSNSPWKAKAHEQLEGLSHKEMKGYLGLTRFKQQKLSGLGLKSDVKIAQTPNKFQSFLQENSNNVHRLHQKIRNGRFVIDEEKHNKLLSQQQKIKEFENDRFMQKRHSQYTGDVCGQSHDSLPRCFDWRDKDGVNYETPIKKQGECGSCYAVATISSLEARIRIKSNNKHKPFISASGSMGCSRYNQGCNGGYPYLVAKQFKEFGAYEESCQPYRDHDQTCKTSCFKEKVWRISDYGYVGKGYYGSTNEEAMKKEIFENGPVVVAFNAAPDLYYYDSGVFITNPTNPLIQSNDHSEVNPWQYTNHAVVAVGWGEQMHNGELLPYWILKNSWGEEWGQQGYFHMLRGSNLGAIENQAVYMNPIID